MMMVMMLVVGVVVLNVGMVGVVVIGFSNMIVSCYFELCCQLLCRVMGNSLFELSCYQSDVKEYFCCVEKYVEVVQNDIWCIQELMDDVVRGVRCY